MIAPQEPDSDGYYTYREGDTFEQADWRCFCTVNGGSLIHWEYPVACPVTYLKMLSLVSEAFWMISTAFTTFLLHVHGLCAAEIEKLGGEYLGM